MDVHESVEAFVSRTDHTLRDFEESLGPRPVAADVLVAAHSFTRSVRLFRAVRVLIRSGFLPEAAILCRALLEEVFRLQEMASADASTRLALALGHLGESAMHARRLGEAARLAKVGVDDGAWEKQAEKVERQIEQAKTADSVTPTGFKTPKTLAAQSPDAALKRNFFEMEVLNFFAHGAAVVRGFTEMTDGDQATVGAPSPDWRPEVLLLQATDYVLQAGIASGNFYGLDSAPFLALQAALESEAEQWLGPIAIDGSSKE